MKTLNGGNVIRIPLDEISVGRRLRRVSDVQVENLLLMAEDTRVEGVLFSVASKLDLATSLKERFQDRRIRIPAGDPALRSDLHAIKSQVGITGLRRLVADDDTDGHADRFWAGALCASAAATPPQAYAYRPAGASAQRARLEEQAGGFLGEAPNPFRGPLGARLRGGI